MVFIVLKYVKFFKGESVKVEKIDDIIDVFEKCCKWGMFSRYIAPKG